MSGKKAKRTQKEVEGEVITEPRFAKASTDRRFAKIAHKDKAIHLDSRFKAIVEDRKFAIAGTSKLCLFSPIKGQEHRFVARTKSQFFFFHPLCINVNITQNNRGVSCFLESLELLFIRVNLGIASGIA